MSLPAPRAGQATRIDTVLTEGAEGTFDDAEVEGLPDAVRRYLGRAVAPGTPLSRSVRIEMSGHLRIGRWLPFRASEVLTPSRGFIWSARVAWVISGSDRYADGHGGLDWKLAGLLPLVHADGPDVSRSSAERAAAEAVWLPTAVMPRFGVAWSAADGHHIEARSSVDGRPVAVRYELDDDALVRAISLERWGDPAGSGEWAAHRFGGELSSHETFGGLTVPTRGRLGWHFGTDRWPEGEFFRFRVTALRPVTTSD